MPTKNTRYNVSLDKESAKMLAALAKRKSLSRSALIKEYVAKGIEWDEDLELSEIATRRDVPSATWIKHDDAWRELLRDRV